MGHVIYVVSSDRALREAVSNQCKARGLHVVSGGGPVQSLLFDRGDVIIVPSTECAPWVCGDLAAAGARVIILAAIVRPGDEGKYRAAKAVAYVPMMVDQTLLSAIVSSAPGP